MESIIWIAKPAVVVITIYGVVKLLSLIFYGRRDVAALQQFFADKTVVITGASSGVGKALAYLLHDCNARLVLTARSIDKLQEICDDLSRLHPQHHTPVFRYLDVSEPNGLDALEIDRLDVLVNNAGMSVRSACADTEMKVHRRLMDVNYFGQIAVTQALLPRLSAHGHIAVVGSIQGLIAVPFRSAYCSTKHAVQAYFDTLRSELEANGSAVKVVVFNPSYIKTDLSRNALTGSGVAYGKGEEALRDGMEPQYVASELLHAIREGREEVLCGPLGHKVAWWLRPVLPSVFFRVLARKAKHEMKQQ